MPNIVARERTFKIIHPKRFIKVRSKTWTKIFGSREKYIDIGNVSIEPTPQEIAVFLCQNKLDLV